MDNKALESYKKKNIDYLYIPYWVTKFQQIIDEVKEEKIRKYDKNRYVKY